MKDFSLAEIVKEEIKKLLDILFLKWQFLPPLLLGLLGLYSYFSTRGDKKVELDK